LLGHAVAAGLRPEVALGRFQDFGATIFSFGTAFDSRHLLLVSIFVSGRVRSCNEPRRAPDEDSGLSRTHSVLSPQSSVLFTHKYGTIFLTVFRFAFETSVSEASAALRPGRFLVRMCEWNAWLRCSLPLPLFLNRLAAPRCVFSFGIARVLTY